MKATVETLETNRVQLDIEVDAADFSQAVDQAYKRLVKKANIPGFRKGKAPRHILERFAGKAVLYEEAFDYLFPEVYAKAVQETGIEPVDQPEVDLPEMEEGKPLHLITKVTVKPVVTLGDYTKISVPRVKVEVTEEEVNSQINFLRDRQAQLVPVDGPVEKGSFVTMDFEGSVGGELFPGGTAKDYTLEIGSGQFIPGYEDQMVGMAKAETKDITVTFPQDYPAEDLAGKEAVFKTTIKEIKKKELPEVDDAFAKTAASKDTVQELRDFIEKRLLDEKERSAKRAFQNDVVRQAVEQSAMEIPPVMVERESEVRFKRLLERLEEMKITITDYCARTGQNVEAIRDEMKDGAEWQVKTDLVIEAIAKKENVEASQDELDASVSEIAERYKQKPEAIRSVLMSQDGLEGLRSAIVTDKTIAFLSKIAGDNADANPQAEAVSGAVTAEEPKE